MERTQLQRRIEASARTNSTHPQNTYFIDTQEYSNKPFINEGDFLLRCLSEKDVKTGNSYDDIKPAIQSRLAHMEYRKDFCNILNKYNRHDSSLAKRVIGKLKIIGINLRNSRLHERVVKQYVKRNGGYKFLFHKSLESSRIDLLFALGSIRKKEYNNS